MILRLVFCKRINFLQLRKNSISFNVNSEVKIEENADLAERLLRKMNTDIDALLPLETFLAFGLVKRSRSPIINKNY